MEPMEPAFRTALRVVHLAALIGWLGFSTGAWLLVRRLERDVRAEVLWPAFARVVDLEHLCLALLAGSGIALWATAPVPLAEQPWFLAKLGLLLGVVAPIEAVDLWRTARVARDPAPERVAAYRRFLVVGGSVLLTAAGAILALGKFRPGS